MITNLSALCSDAVREGQPHTHTCSRPTALLEPLKWVAMKI